MADRGRSGRVSIVEEWPKLAAVAVVAIILAAIGWSVADSFEPGTPRVAAVVTTTTTAPRVVDPSVTTTFGVSPVATTSPAETVVLGFSQEGISFGDDGETLEVQLTNDGDAAGAWSVVADHAALNVTPASGELGPTESLTLTITLDRAQVELGEFNSVISVSWDGGTAELSAVANVTDTVNPIIHSPRASPETVQVASGEDCSPTTTTISARVRDTSDLERVVVRWDNGSGQVETTMSAVGDEMYEAKIGPFSAIGSVSARIVAFDVHGNAGGASASVTVTGCP
jgi:hypothetical protein